MNPLFSRQSKTLHAQNQTGQLKAVTANKKILQCISFCLLLLGSMSFVNGQSYLKKAQTGNSGNTLKSLGWTGREIIPVSKFFNKDNWVINFMHNSGDTCYVTTDDTCVYLHWKFVQGDRHKFAQCYQILYPSISLSGKDFYSIDIKGSRCSVNKKITLKFEDGRHRPNFSWSGLAGITRWCERLGVLKNQFDERDSMNWSAVTTVSLDVNNLTGDNTADSGIVIFRNLQADSVALWQRAGNFETLKDSSILSKINQETLNAILKRQNSTGLFSSWLKDTTSELYGQGLVLKILATEGNWKNSQPVDPCSIAAEKLALFLVKSQNQYGFWPNKWNIHGIAIDNTLWMPSFPWIITGLQSYYNKSGDIRVKIAIDKAKSFLYSLIEGDTLYTIDLELKKTKITDGRAYAAAIQSLFELGDSVRAKSLLQYIDQKLWDAGSKYWRESFESPRIVLFGNTWLSLLEKKWEKNDKPLNSLSVVGKALYTIGPGAPGGFDDYGPIATCYEATLSYICAGGPGSNALFYDLINYRQADHSLSYYNDSIDNIDGIWAVKWSNLEATAWLYYAASKKSPFDIEKQLIAPFEEPKKVFMIYRGWYGDSISDRGHWSTGIAQTPLIGKYDSGSWALQTYHLLLSQSCGIDGLILNLKDDYDAQSLNTLMSTIKRIRTMDSVYFQYSFALMYDDQDFDKNTINQRFNDLRNSILPSTKNYLFYYGKPAVFVFHYKNPLLSAGTYKKTLNSVFNDNVPMLLWTSMESTEDSAKYVDAYYPWIQPGGLDWDQGGMNWGKEYLDYFYWRVNTIDDTTKQSIVCGAIWPGFDDRKNKWGKNRFMDRRNGDVYKASWQIATNYHNYLPLKWMMIEEWNNWNDGTQIEPSKENGYQYLKLTIDAINSFKGTNIAIDTCKFEAAKEIYKAARLIELGKRGLVEDYDRLELSIRYFLRDDCEKAMLFAKYITDTTKTTTEETVTKSGVEIYPNPANRLLYIKFKSNRPADIEISNMNGQVILVKQLQSPGESIDIATYPRGIFFIKVITDDHLEVHKVIFQ